MALPARQMAIYDREVECNVIIKDPSTLWVLAGSAAYAVAEAFDWRTGLDLKPIQGKRFYGIFSLATLGGVILCFTPVDPMKEFFYSAVINGVIAVPITN